GNTGFSSGQIWYPTILTDSLNNVYVEYYDEADSNKISVLKLELENLVADKKPGESVTAFPNPASDKISFTIPDEAGNYELKISNVLGEEIYSRVAHDKKLSVDISLFESGIYFYEINFRGPGYTSVINTRGKFLK